MVKSRKLVAFIAVWVVSFIFAGNIYGQEETTGGYYVEEPRIFYGGLVAGANFCQVDGDYYAGYHKTGLNVGGIVYAQLKKHIALSMEILYSEKGSKSNYVRLISDGTNPAIAILKYGINTNYAEIPVMLNYFDKRKSHFGVGLSYSQLVSATENVVTDPAPPPVDVNKYPFKKSDLDVLAGVQMHLVKGFFLNVRFQYSVIPVRSDVPPGYSRSSQYQNLWVVRLMYLFI